MPVKMKLSLKGKEKKGETPGYLFSEAEFFLSEGNSTYGQSLQLLQKECINDPTNLQPLFQKDDGSKIYRPLSFREHFLAAVENFNREYDQSGIKRKLEERVLFFSDRLFNTCTGVAYKAATSKLKIIPQSSSLIELNPYFEGSFMSIDYNLIDGHELDWQKHSTEAVLVAALEDDKALFQEYKSIAIPIAMMNYRGGGFSLHLRSEKLTPGEDLLLPVLFAGGYYSFSAKDFTDNPFIRLSKCKK